MGQLSLTGLIVALDAFGPITDNAGGIAEMADLPEEVAQRDRPARRGRQHDEGGHEGLRDRLGRCSPRWCCSRASAQELADTARGTITLFGINEPPVLIGLLLGGLMVCLFASLSIEAVGRAGGAVVEEVRRQFREHPGIMEGTEAARLRDAASTSSRKHARSGR